MARTALAPAPPSLVQQIDALLGEHEAWKERAEAVLELGIDEIMLSTSGVPRNTVRQCEIDARAAGYAYAAALEVLRRKLAPS
jgi:hypothetical protein